MSLSKSKCLYSNNCLQFLKRAVPLASSTVTKKKVFKFWNLNFWNGSWVVVRLPLNHSLHLENRKHHQHIFGTREALLKGRISTADLLVLTSLDQLFFKLKLFFKTTYLNSEVDCTEPSPSVRVPCWDPCCHLAAETCTLIPPHWGGIDTTKHTSLLHFILGLYYKTFKGRNFCRNVLS